MKGLSDTNISLAIVNAYHEKLVERIVSDILIVGAGPSGLTCAYYLARHGLRVTIVEKRLAPGGGIWGGGMAMNEVVVQNDALDFLRDMGVGYNAVKGELFTVDAIELASGLCLNAIKAGAKLFNLMTVEDVCIHDERMTGIVINRSLISGALPVDPITLSAKAVIDATGHEAAVVRAVRRRNLMSNKLNLAVDGEGPMNASAGEEFVVEKIAEVFPGLWVTGMSVCAALGGPRMGPIFGGMLLSGSRVAEKVIAALGSGLSGAGDERAGISE